MLYIYIYNIVIHTLPNAAGSKIGRAVTHRLADTLEDFMQRLHADVRNLVRHIKSRYTLRTIYSFNDAAAGLVVMCGEANILRML